MTLLSEETEVFQAAEHSTCAVVFLARRRVGLRAVHRLQAYDTLAGKLEELATRGWLLSTRAMFGPGNTEAWAYDSGFAHDVDITGVFEAPNTAEALTGIDALESSGWDHLLATEWIVGPREFAPVTTSTASRATRTWGFIALWEWNDAWQSATPEQRREYDSECDVAFQSDVKSGIDIAGRHCLDWASSWHHLGIWESDDFNAIDAAMREHERVGDFKFTTSRHFIGRCRPLLSLLGAPDA